ncbi:MAG: MBL fold metallo-hydrolase, partial [Hyphomicrobium denitrificans]|nr:MBL fold metallo-hydrolase [Hyphomicrobium denitrificans]
MTYRFTILGCGSSGGVPRVGMNWGACDPQNPKNNRLRCSALVERKGPGGQTAVLIDTSPDFRAQILATRLTGLDAV